MEMLRGILRRFLRCFLGPECRPWRQPYGRPRPVLTSTTDGEQPSLEQLAFLRQNAGSFFCQTSPS
jgi:hypothetical protein